MTEWQLIGTQWNSTALTARHWDSKELFATTYWTLIGPTFLIAFFRPAHQCLISFPRTTFLANFRAAIRGMITLPQERNFRALDNTQLCSQHSFAGATHGTSHFRAPNAFVPSFVAYQDSEVSRSSNLTSLVSRIRRRATSSEMLSTRKLLIERRSNPFFQSRAVVCTHSDRVRQQRTSQRDPLVAGSVRLHIAWKKYP